MEIFSLGALYNQALQSVKIKNEQIQSLQVYKIEKNRERVEMDIFIKLQNKGPSLKLEKVGFRKNGKNYFFFFNTVGDKLMELIIPTIAIH